MIKYSYVYIYVNVKLVNISCISVDMFFLAFC